MRFIFLLANYFVIAHGVRCAPLRLGEKEHTPFPACFCLLDLFVSGRKQYFSFGFSWYSV